MSKILTVIFVFVVSISFSQNIDDELLTAAYENNEKAIFDLLRCGADPNTATDDGTTPLMYAVQNGNYLICKKLISSGADVNYSSTNRVPPLLNAVMNSDTGIVLLLLENGADPNAIHLAEKKSALLFSIKRNNFFLTEALLQYGANPNKFVEGVSAIMQAIYLGVDTSFILLLLDYGANPNLVNDKGYSPLMICVLYENIVVTKLLLKNGAIPITEKNSSYFTSENVLDYAIDYRLEEFVDLYLPYFENNLKHYHTKTITNNYLSGAKKIRKYSKKPYLSPILNKFIFSSSLIFNHKDFLAGFKIGFSEARYNLSFKFAIEPRIVRKSVLIEHKPNYFLQLWEKRTLLVFEIDKDFVIKSTVDANYGFFVRAKAVYSFGDYSGTDISILNPFVLSPTVGIFKQQGFVKLGIGYSYLPIQTDFPHYFVIDINLLIPFIN